MPGSPLGVEQGAVYTITGPNGETAVLNDPTSPSFVGFLTAPPGGLERAGVRENGEDLPGEDGGAHGSFLYGRRAFSLEGIVPAEADAGGSWLSRQSRLLAATDAMRADATLSWSPAEASPVRILFRQQQPTRLSDRRPKRFLVAGVGTSPSIESVAVHTASITGASATPGGVDSPVTSPLTSGASSPYGVVCINDGNGKAWPTIRIYGPCSNPTLFNPTVGAQMALSYTIADGDWLTVQTDPRSRGIWLNDTTKRNSALQWSSSRWWWLAGGANTVVAGFAAVGPTAHVDVSWRDTWT